MRDFILVADLADAHVLALNSKKCTVNLGTGSGYSVLEIIDAVERFCGSPIRVKREKRREGEPSILSADNKRAKELLGWSPKVSDLATLVESAWKWHKFLHENAPLIQAVLTC